MLANNNDLLTSLSGYYKLEEASSTRFDITANDNDLSDVGSVARTVGHIASGANFNRTGSQRLDAATSGVYAFGDEDFAIACWVRMDQNTVNQGIVNKWTVTGNQRSWSLFYLGGGTNVFRFVASNDGIAASVVDATTFGTPTLGDWNFIVCWHDSVANNIHIQINNGTIETTSHTTGIFDTQAIFNLGLIVVGGPTNEYLDGGIDELGIWRRLLNNTERTQLYNGGIGLTHSFYQDAPLTHPTEFGGYVMGEDVPVVSGLFGGMVWVTLENSAQFGGHLLARALDDHNNVGLFGGYIEADATGQLTGHIGGYLSSLNLLLTSAEYGGLASGLFQKSGEFGGWTFGVPSGVNFTELHARTLVKVRSEDVVDQPLNLDAKVILKQETNSDFNSKFIWYDESNSDFNAKFKVERFALLPSVNIISTTPTSGAPGDGCVQVTVVASGTLGDGREWTSAQIDFGEPLVTSSPRTFTHNLSVSGFTTPPPWTSVHDYCSSGRYVITVRGQDNLGLVDMDCFHLNLASGLSDVDFPRLDINATPQNGTVPESVFVQFGLNASGLEVPPFTIAESGSLQITGNSDRRILWSFGNRGTSQRTAPSVNYQSPGNYVVTLRYQFQHPSGGLMWMADTLKIGYNN